MKKGDDTRNGVLQSSGDGVRVGRGGHIKLIGG